MKIKQFFVMSVLVGVTSILFAQGIDAAVKKSVDDLASDISSRITVGIGVITLGDTGTTSALSSYLRDQISLYASQNKMYQVMSNDEVNSFEGATNFSQTRSANPLGNSSGTAKLKIQGMISGKFTNVGDNVEVYLWLRATSDGRNIDSVKFSIPVSELAKAQIDIYPPNVKTESAITERQEVLKPFNDDSNPFKLLIWTGDADYVFHDGDSMSFHVMSEKDCYIKVYYVSVTGDLQVIFPLSANDDNFLPANKILTLPPDGITYKMVSPYGEENIMVVASTQAFEFIKEETHATKITRDAIRRGLAVITNRDLPSGKSIFSTAQFSYTVLP